MARRIKRPNKLRCLAGSAYATFALLMVVLINRFNGTLCALVSARSPLVECAPVPASFVHVLLWAAAVGWGWTCYRAYRDFYAGDYFMDLVIHADQRR